MKATLLRSIAVVLVLASATGSRAGTVDLSDVPLGNSIDPAVKPNIMFILDRSGSMAWDYLPDSPLNGWSGQIVGYRSSQCNGVYYNPSVVYAPPVYADGSSYPAANFTGAKSDGFAGTGNVDLRSGFRVGNDTAQAAYYYQYNGAGGTGTKLPAMSYTFTAGGAVDTTTTFYKQCAVQTNDPSVGAAASHTWTKVVVGASEEQNFANWYSYYRTRLLMMKSAAGLALKQLNNPNFLRLGLVYHDYWTYSGGRFLPIADYSDTTGVSNACPGSTQRAKLYCMLYGATAYSGTPTRTALSKTGQIFAHTISGTYADPVQYKCQRNSAIMATDGFWNSDCGAGGGQTDCWNTSGGLTAVGDQDGGTTPAPYNGNTSTGSATTNTMADIAMYFYQTHLRPALDNPAPPATDKPIAACPQVPKDGWVRQTAKDCATYQHMNTYTLGLGASGSLTYAWGYETPGTSTDYDQIVAGTKQWPDPTNAEDIHRIDDLWHAAVNGRGLYFSATNVSTLANGLKQAFAGAAEQGGAAAPAVPSLSVSSGDAVYQSGYKTDEWSGELQKFLIDPKTGAISGTASWAAQAQLDSQTTANSDTRNILFANGTSLVQFDAGNLATAKANKWFDAGPTNPNGALEQYQFFNAAQIAAATPDSLIAYIRGQRGLEDVIVINGVKVPSNDTTSTDVTKLYRARTHVLGDLVNSPPLFIKGSVYDYQDSGYQSFKTATAGRDGFVYVGGNDGMLHAFDENGVEKWAFVPTAVLPYLYKLADKNYGVKHRYFVDGWITLGDADFGGPDWHTVLIGGLGKGGRAYYALDITDPHNPKLLWEFASSTAGTATGTYDSDLGYTPDGAQITKLKGGTYNGKWVAAFASGYNNTSPGDGKSRVYVVDIQTGAKMAEIVTTSGDTDPLTSGIGWIQGWTDDGMKDNSSKDVYAGDLRGRIWRFDTVAQTATLLTTLGSSTLIQPVTSRVELGEFANDVNQRVVYVGTGRYLGYCDIDPAPYPTACPAGSTYYPINALQSLYAIRDTGNSLKSNVGNPYFRSVAIPLAVGDRSSSMTYNNVTTNTNGWYLDFTAQAGERVTIQPNLVDWNNLTVITNVPASDKCAVGGTSWVYSLFTQPDKSIPAPANTWVSLGGALAVGGVNLTLQNGEPVVVVSKSDGTTVTIRGTAKTYGNKIRRVTWRELVD